MLIAGKIAEIERGGRHGAGAGEVADAREAAAREGVAPSGGEGGRVGAGGEREDEFVVLAVGEAGAEVGAAAQRKCGRGRGPGRSRGA